LLTNGLNSIILNGFAFIVSKPYKTVFQITIILKNTLKPHPIRVYEDMLNT